MIEELLIRYFPENILIAALIIYNHKILRKNHEILEEIKKYIR